MSLETKETAEKWRYEIAIMRKPKLEEACGVILDLCATVSDLERQLDAKKQDDLRHKQSMDAFVSGVQDLARKYSSF